MSAGSLGTSAEWFDSNPPESSFVSPRLSGDAEAYRVSGDAEPYRVVSRRRLRLAHALFAALFLALLALVAWEVNVYYGGAPLARISAWLNGSH